MFSSLITGAGINLTEPTTTNKKLNDEIYLTELTHMSGVNALKENQTIKFSNNVTILYGLNGAGKSSYFKVLNEIVGGNQKKEILPNIYSNQPEEIEIELIFKKAGGGQEVINWTGESRSHDFVNKCKVFDTSYLNGLLETRETDSTLVQPLGLNLFTYVVKLIDKFKEDLNDEIDKKRSIKPALELQNLRDEIKAFFENHKIDNGITKQIEGLYDFSGDDSKKMANLKQTLLDLNTVNIQDKIELRTNDSNDLLSLKNDISGINEKLSGFSTRAQSNIQTLAANKIANDSAKAQFEILSTIPGNDTAEWKEFIKSGERYKLKVDGSNENCLYCRQLLQGENVRIIEAYGNFLKDESEQKLNISISEIENLIKSVELLTTEIPIKQSVRNILEGIKVDGGKGKTLYRVIIEIIEKFSFMKANLIKQLKENEINVKTELINITNIVDEIGRLSENIKTEIGRLSGDESKKIKKIEKIKRSLSPLLENESISKQQETIRKWLEVNKAENELRIKHSAISTTAITNLSKKAHNDLLSETLKRNFIEELKSLRFQNLDVKIENARSTKGTPNTKLTLSKNYKIKQILSEGEQKAVALALFLTEAKIQKIKNPIILDDPVNSLDHKVAAKFAESLLKLNNQIIIFSHDKFFLDAFETSRVGHVCKNFTNGCNSNGKHIIIYRVNSEGINSKGILSYYNSNKAENHIVKARVLLNISPFNRYTEVAGLLRKAVECTIDEVIFNNQLPTKCSSRNSRINWNELEKLNSNSDTINKLKGIHGRVSSGEIHNGIENEENPIEVEDFKQMIEELEQINQ